MSKKNPNAHTITVHMDPEIAQIVDQTLINFGLDNRSSTICMMVKAFSSMFPERTTVFEVAQQATREIRKAEFESLATYYEERAKVARASAR